MRQIAAITMLNLRALPQRWGTAVVTLVGVASVVAVMTSVLAIGAGLLTASRQEHPPAQAIVLSAGAPSEYASAITPQDVVTLSQAPGVRRDPGGRPIVQPQLSISVEVTRRTDGAPESIDLLGSGEQGWAMAPHRRIVAGRMYRTGLQELVVGRKAAQRYRDLRVGDHIPLRGTTWTVVGEFVAPGSLSENRLIADADTVRAALDRPAYQSVLVMLQSPAAFGGFRDALLTNASLNVDVRRAGDYAREQMVQLTAIVTFVGYVVGGVMAVGAAFAALNTMQTLVEGRARELATLQAVGFGRAAVVVAILLESQMLALTGALVGGAVAWMAFNGRAFSTVGLSFPFEVSPPLLAQGVFVGLGLGLVAGLAPALHAVRGPVIAALRAG